MRVCATSRCVRWRIYADHAACPRSRRAVGVAARSRRDLDHRQSESLPFICEWVEAVALLPQAWRDTARAMSEENVEIVERGLLRAINDRDVDACLAAL